MNLSWAASGRSGQAWGPARALCQPLLGSWGHPQDWRATSPMLQGRVRADWEGRRQQHLRDPHVSVGLTLLRAWDSAHGGCRPTSSRCPSCRPSPRPVRGGGGGGCPLCLATVLVSPEGMRGSCQGTRVLGWEVGRAALPPRLVCTWRLVRGSGVGIRKAVPTGASPRPSALGCNWCSAAPPAPVSRPFSSACWEWRQACPTPNTYHLALYRDLVAQMVKTCCM